MLNKCFFFKETNEQVTIIKKRKQIYIHLKGNTKDNNHMEEMSTLLPESKWEGTLSGAGY
jgi:hypothetical protein